ncbi:alpha/beta fold hydrolase [Paraburkholderia rhizosphaerae]|uniref:Proline iminopeptidase n=1 Tax=Paraburkholderia rhizosphaerae TaxID=480658 RepID=A0A4V3HE96_9BURK|nr:alpha/beta fold hydrolase [Paraburkholderia rhizosphaerae]TDY45365.1 prolyl aminopeptidase [Paraburkholderia rhizosphaerae]
MTDRTARPRPPMARIKRHTLRTDDGHRIAFAVAGSDTGIPIVVLHGGPGSGTNRSVLDLFDLNRFRVVMIDQRGAGASRPTGSLRRNNTGCLTDDIEAVRKRLGIDRWGVLGGSWGAALALAYAGSHPQAVRGVVLRGMFLTSAREVDGLFLASRGRAPREWQALVKAARCTHRQRLFDACATILLHSCSHAAQRAVALAWSRYEYAVLMSAHRRRRTRATRHKPAAVRRQIAMYQVQSHYLLHRCWLGEPRLLSLARRAALAGVPIAAAHGTRDPVCPVINVERLARAVPQARIERVNAGHLGSEPTLRDAVKRAIESLWS